MKDLYLRSFMFKNVQTKSKIVKPNVPHCSLSCCAVFKPALDISNHRFPH